VLHDVSCLLECLSELPNDIINQAEVTRCHAMIVLTH